MSHQITKMDPKMTKMDPKGPKWSQIVKMDPKMTNTDPKWIQNGPKIDLKYSNTNDINSR